MLKGGLAFPKGGGFIILQHLRGDADRPTMRTAPEKQDVRLEMHRSRSKNPWGPLSKWAGVKTLSPLLVYVYDVDRLHTTERMHGCAGALHVEGMLIAELCRSCAYEGHLEAIM